MEYKLILSSHNQCQVLMDLVEDGRAHLPDFGSELSFGEEEVIYTYGDIVNSLYLVKRGRIRTSTISSEGRELVTGIHGPGAMFGQFCLCQQQHRNEQAIALEPSHVAGLGVKELIDLASTRDGALGILQLFCRRISTLEQQLAELAFAKVRTRLALLLLRLAEEGVPQPDGSQLCHDSPTHEEMSSRIGTTREQVTALLAEFRKAEFIDYKRTGPLRVYPNRLQAHLDSL